MEHERFLRVLRIFQAEKEVSSNTVVAYVSLCMFGDTRCETYCGKSNLTRFVCFFYVSRAVAFKTPYAILPRFSRNTGTPTANQICSAVHPEAGNFSFLLRGHGILFALGSTSKTMSRRNNIARRFRCDNLYECRRETGK